MKKYKYEIGIGITEHNRPEVFKECLKNIKKYLPKDARIIVVDDASDIPLEGATYRFEENAGIARAKNKCLELLQDCKHVFLFDSDCWPKSKGWEKQYINSKEPHLCYIFQDFVDRKLNDCVLLYRDSEISGYSHARGCMLYFDQICMETIGGMDTRYRRWGYEHVDMSNRIYNAGLTSFRYQDVVGSNQLIHSLDENIAVKSTVSYQERAPYLQEMKSHFEASFNSTQFCPYIDNYTYDDQYKDKKNILLTCFFTGQRDPQRNTQWEADHSQIQKLIDSLQGETLVVLNDCFDLPDSENVKYVKVECAINPYHQRWLSYYQYLRDHPEVDFVFCVDATDVEMLRSPFYSMTRNNIYTGDEPTQLWSNWMISNHRVNFLLTFMRQNAQKQLLNAGLLGGTRENVLKFIHEMNKVYFDEKTYVGNADMGLFNYVARTKFNSEIINGQQVNTKFKGYERDNKISWFRHK